MRTFEEKLMVVSEAWVAEGVISPSQREALLIRHPVPAGGVAASRFLGILAVIGGALFVVGVSLVIKSNWAQLGDWVKIFGLVALLFGSYALGWRLKFSVRPYPKSGDACFMVGAVLFLLGIALVSQIFHIDGRPADGVLVWWAGIVALPWIARAKGAQFVSVTASLTWLAMEFESHNSWLSLAGDSGSWYDDNFYLFAAVGYIVGMSLLHFGAGLRTGRNAEFSGLHEKLGLGLMCWTLYGLGFSWSAHGSSHSAIHAARWPALLLLTGLALGSAGWAFAKGRAIVRSLGWLILPGLVPVGARLLGIELLDSGWLLGGLSCLALFLLNVGMFRMGLAEGREGWINLGIAGIALNVVTRYFLLFGTMMEGGFFFIVTGLLVLSLGFVLERKRRSLVSAVRTESGP
jgi:uncharacterized membrane protein